jgi:DNA-damage-inducible protein J
MAAQRSMLHVRVDDKLRKRAAKKLVNFGLTVSDAVHILLTRVVKKGALPVGLTIDPKA